MFGYVKPVTAELLVREHEFYRAAYCGVCRAMKRHTGTLSNVTLTYDSVFLALVRMLYLEDSEYTAKMRRCIAHPLKKRPMLGENEAIEYTARAFAILSYYKMADDLHDEPLRKRIATSCVRPIVTHAKVLAKKPDLAEIVAGKLAEITALEDAASPNIDMLAALFGELLGEVFAYGKTDSDRLVLHECGYHLGKFIYCADAAEDYDKDIASGSYNPYAVMYEHKPLTPENRQTIKCALLLECKNLEAAVNLLPFGNRVTIENIIRNIIYLGLPKRISFLDGAENKDETHKEKLS